MRLQEALKKAKEAANKNKDVKKTGKGSKKSKRKKLKLDALSESTQTDFKPKKIKTKERETSTDEPLLSISEAGNIVTFEGEKSFRNLEKVSDFVHIPAKPKESSSVIVETGRVFFKSERGKTKEQGTAVGSQTVDFDGSTENNFSVPGQVKAPLQTSDTGPMIFSALGKSDNKVSLVDTIELAGEEPKKNENTITSDKGFEIQAKPSAKAVKPNLPSQQFNFSLSVKKKVDPTVTDTFKTPSKKKDNDADQSKVKTKKSQTKRKKRYLLSSYDVDGLLGDILDEDEESEKEEKVVPGREVSAFTLDEKSVAKNKISKTESIQILQKKEKKPLLAPTKPVAVEVKATKKQPPKFEISKTQPITAEAQAVETKESATETKKPMKFDDLKSTKAVLESVLRTKDSRDTEVQTADKVPLFTKSTSLFIEKEKSSKDLIIDLDEDEASVSEEAAAEKVKELFKIEYPKLSKSVSLLKESVKFGEKADVTKTLSELRKKQQMLQKKIEDFEKTFHKPYFQTHHGFVCELSDELDAIETMLQGQKPLLNEPKATEVNNMFKPGWSVLEMNSINTAGGTFEGEKQPKSSPKFFLPWPTDKVCFLAKPTVMIDFSAQADEPRRFLGNLQSENVMKESFVDDKLSLVSRLEQKKLKHKKLKSDYLDLQKNALDMLDINNEYHDENEKIKIINREQNQEIEALKKRYETLSKAFEEFRNLVGTECGYFEFESEKVLNEAKAIALEAMEGITDGTLRGEKAEKLLKRYGETAGRWSSVSHKCDNSVCLQRQRFMDSLALLLWSRLRIRGADAFKAIRSQQWMIKGGVSKTSKPFEVIPANSFGLDVDPKIKSEKEAKKEQLSKLTTENKELMAENEDLKSKLKEESDNKEALFDIMANTDGEDKEALGKENKALKQKLAELEEKNKEKDEEIEKLKKYDAQSNELFQTAYSDNDKLRKALEEKDKEINDQKRKYRMLQEEMEKIRQEKDKEIDAQKRENLDLVGENILLEFENKVLKNHPKNEDDEKKNSKDKKFEKLQKKPTDPKTIKEVDDFRNRLKRAGDNLRTVKNAEERKKEEEKRKKEALEAEKETNELKQKLKDAKNVKQLKQVIMAFLDNAERRLIIAAKEFEDTESFVKEIEDAYGSDSEQTRKIAQKNASGSFVHTVSALQKNVIEAWKRMTVILKPKALPKEVLEKVTADEEEKKINREAERRKRAVVQEKDTEIADLKKKLEEMKKEYKVKVFDLENSLRAAKKLHTKTKTEANVLHETNVSPLYNFNDTSDIRDKKDRDNGRYSTPCETQGKNKLRNGYARNHDNYSRDSSRRRSFTHSKTLLKGLENSDLRFKKYKESQIKPDKTFETLDAKGRISFTDQSKGNTFLKDIEETADEIHEDGETTNLSAIQKVREQMMRCMCSVSSLPDFTWDSELNKQYGLLKEGIRNFFEYVEKENKRTSGLRKSVTKKKLKTEKAETKTQSRLLLSTTATDKLTEDNSEVVQDLNQKFNSENSGLKTKETELFYKKIDPKISSGKKKQKRK